MKEKTYLINAWKEEVDNIFDKKIPKTDIGRKIYKNCMRFSLPKQCFIDLIDAISMDMPNPVQAPSLKTFDKYCYGVAGVPGNISLRIFGLKDEKHIKELSTNLGSALQITNILRDMKEDAQIDRLYMPKELLVKAGIDSTNPQIVLTDKNLVVAREALAKIANDHYTKADGLIQGLDKNIMLPVKMIENIYKAYFNFMQNRGWEVISPKPKFSKSDKFKIAIRTVWNVKRK